MKNREDRCPDCLYCQGCSKSRCRLCRSDDLQECPSGLGTGFTYGQYMEWKKDKEASVRQNA